MRLIDLTGQIFGRLIAITPYGSNTGKWNCRCACGNHTVVIGNNLRRGHTTSCGCYHKERMRIIKSKHTCYACGEPTEEHNGGFVMHTFCNTIHNKWDGLNQRCYITGNASYANYGGRGITVCPEWRKDNPNGFKNFYTWALGSGFQPGLTIDRIESNGNYEPTNCRWATWQEQANNRRPLALLEYKDLTGTVFGNVTVLGPYKYTLDYKLLWGYDCVCGGSGITEVYSLIAGTTKSCGHCGSIRLARFKQRVAKILMSRCRSSSSTL